MTITSWGRPGGLNELTPCKHMVNPKKMEAIMITLLWPTKSESLVLSFHHILFVWLFPGCIPHLLLQGSGTGSARQRTSEYRVISQQGLRGWMRGYLVGGPGGCCSWPGPRLRGMFLHRSSIVSLFHLQQHKHIYKQHPGDWMKKNFREMSLERQSSPKSFNPIFPALMLFPKMLKHYRSNQFAI